MTVTTVRLSFVDEEVKAVLDLIRGELDNQVDPEHKELFEEIRDRIVQEYELAKDEEENRIRNLSEDYDD
tara:strand:+ start:165 stop:374 length:210 start_codon:yes stop_codon:yes gene_type:complete